MSDKNIDNQLIKNTDNFILKQKYFTPYVITNLNNSLPNFGTGERSRGSIQPGYESVDSLHGNLAIIFKLPLTMTMWGQFEIPKRFFFFSYERMHLFTYIWKPIKTYFVCSYWATNTSNDYFYDWAYRSLTVKVWWR